MSLMVHLDHVRHHESIARRSPAEAGLQACRTRPGLRGRRGRAPAVPGGRRRGRAPRNCHTWARCLVDMSRQFSMEELTMRVFVAGATGAMGTQLVPRLVANGHEVHGMTRSESKQAMLRELGAVPVVADALDPDQVATAVGRAKPDVIVHQLTALAGKGFRGLKQRIEMTNRLRSEGTDHLLSAGQAVGVQRFVAQSNAALYARTGGPVKTEDDPLDTTPPRKQRDASAAIFHLEEAVLGATWTEGIVLRYGGFYGPRPGVPGGETHELIQKRKFPLVG